MSQFKRFNSSENSNWDDWATYPAGTLTWNPNMGLRIHDGYTGGGNVVGGSSFSGSYWDLSNRPQGNTALSDLIGGSGSNDNGKFYMQVSTGVTEWTSLPSTYSSLDIGTVHGAITGAGGTKITGMSASFGQAAPYRQVLLNPNQAFMDFFNRGSSIIGWKVYPESNPSAYVTVTEYLNYDLGGPSLGFDTGYLSGNGPWAAESPNYSAGTPGPVTVSANNKSWVFNTSGNVTFPDNTVQTSAYQTTTAPTSSKGVSGNKQGMVAFDSSNFYYCKQDYTDGVADIWVKTAWTSTSW